MHIQKRYGQSKVDLCPFCNKQAISENEQGVPVCVNHKDNMLPELKCLCGEYLMINRGKFGVFFNCIKCGNKNLKKALEINNLSSLLQEQKISIHTDDGQYEKRTFPNPKPKNITIRSDDPDYFD